MITFNMRLLPLSLLPFIFSLLPPSFPNTIARPGCPDHCGNLSIPFPFGIGPDCSMEQSFNIFCNTSANPPKAYVTVLGNVEVIEIEQSRVRVKLSNLVLSCYTVNRGLDDGFTVYYNMGGTQYTFSDGNWVTAIGCDDAVAVTGQANRDFGGGCTTFCHSRSDSGGFATCPDDSNGYQLGSGCCRSPIPRGTTSLAVNLSDVHKNWRRGSKLFNCSYAFLGETGIANQRLSELNNSTIFLSDNWAGKYTPPVVLDWRIRAVNCSEARRNRTTYACQDNSKCVDFDANIQGYHCRCLDGYGVNPYLTPGCQDIDECADTTTNPCVSNANCINTEGSVECSCHRGYYGDGKSEGTGCNPMPRSEMINNLLIGLGCGLGFLLLLPICFWLHKVQQKRKSKKHKEDLFKHLLLQHQTNEDTFGRTKLFSAKEMEKATDNFNESRILGKGGQGIVYKGMLYDGTIVAIKKLLQVDEDQVEQFINEVVILSQVNHRNVVKLLGCCLAIEVPLLVYEFVPNGTLFDLIHKHETESSVSVSWNMRLKIATDTAGALAYLHFACSVPIYHRDIKPTNILLDEKYIVKVSDFGTSKFVAVDQTHLTTLVKGTFGYLDPEYLQTSQFTEKSDVYSFGVVLVELLTGQRAISLERSQVDRSLATRFLVSMETNNLEAILDKEVSKQAIKEEVIVVARLAQRCLNFKGKMRPTMKEVENELESLMISQMASTANHEFEEATVYEAKLVMIPNIDYTWTSGDSVASSSSDAHHPLVSTKF